MRNIYLFTNINDRNEWPVQRVLSPNEIVNVYIDNEYYAVCRAVPDTGKTCFGCVLADGKLNHRCAIKVIQSKYILIDQSVCNYGITRLEPIDILLEDL